MKKQIKVSMTATAALLALAGVAQAAPAELNIYGASAQYTYWSAQAQNYAQNVLGCTATAPVNNGGKHGFVHATGCTSTLVPLNTPTSRDLDIRYSGIASAEGVLAVKKAAPLDSSLAIAITTAANPTATPPVLQVTANCDVTKGERAMYASSNTTVCKQVHVGTSDVAGESLVQVSSGQKLGPVGGGSFGATMTAIDTTSLTPNNTVVVPFGFFVNSNVTAKQCTTGLVGQYCTTNAHCTTNSGTAGLCGAASTISNISREEASLLFSGLVSDWSDLGAYFTAEPVTVCLRHAGSGTHAALDLTVVNSVWGGSTAVAEAGPTALNPVSPYIWFNQGSGDEMKCINGNATTITNGVSVTSTGSLIGAIGYADADQATGVAATSQNVVPVKYNGQYGTRSAIRNGQYDFYTNAWLYTNPINTGNVVLPVAYDVNSLAASMVAFAQDPANVPASKANYWAATAEMKFNRAADNTYPTNIGGASIPQTP